MSVLCDCIVLNVTAFEKRRRKQQHSRIEQSAWPSITHEDEQREEPFGGDQTQLFGRVRDSDLGRWLACPSLPLLLLLHLSRPLLTTALFCVLLVMFRGCD